MLTTCFLVRVYWWVVYGIWKVKQREQATRRDCFKVSNKEPYTLEGQCLIGGMHDRVPSIQGLHRYVDFPERL